LTGRLVYVLLFFLTSFTAQIAKAESKENFKINTADTLDILEDRVVLNGHVSVSSIGADSFTLYTDKIVAVKDASGEYANIECFGSSRITSQRFNMTADKIFFLRDPKTQKFSLLDAKGNVIIKSVDGSQLIKSPKVLVDMTIKKLFASEGVVSEQLTEDKGKKQKVTITSDKQEINLDETNVKPGQPNRQLLATIDVLTVLEGEAEINSQQTEIFSINGKGERAVFTGNASLKAKDGTNASSDKITYFLQTKTLSLENMPGSGGVELTKEDGTKIEGDSINFNSATNTLEVNSQSGSVLKVPFADGDKVSEMTIKADFIENKELSPTQSRLTAKQAENHGLAELIYGETKGWGETIYISQNKSVPEKKGDYLTLVGNAKIYDPANQQTIQAPVIEINLGDKKMNSGFTGRVSGYFPMKQNKEKTSKGKKTSGRN
jgi:lipopolysaccharide export system protein LptA